MFVNLTSSGIRYFQLFVLQVLQNAKTTLILIGRTSRDYRMVLYVMYFRISSFVFDHLDPRAKEKKMYHI